jgi:hypothetical protein
MDAQYLFTVFPIFWFVKADNEVRPPARGSVSHLHAL